MSYINITLKDLSEAPEIVDTTVRETLNPPNSRDTEFIDPEIRIVEEPKVPFDIFAPENVEYNLRITDINETIESIPNYIFPMLANVKTITIGDRFSKNRKDNTTGLRGLLKTIIASKSTLGNYLTISFDSIYTCELYDDLAYDIISYCINTGIGLKYLSIPISTLFHMADEDGNLDNLYSYIKRGKVQDISFNEAFSEVTTRYQDDTLKKDSSLFKIVFKFLYTVLDNEELPINILLQALPTDYSIHKNLDYGTKIMNAKVSLSKVTGEHLHTKSSLYSEIISHVLEHYGKEGNMFLIECEKSIRRKRKNIYLFCGLEYLDQLVHCPNIMANWTLVFQLTNKTLDMPIDIGTKCLEVAQPIIESMNLSSSDKDDSYQTIVRVIKSVQYFNSYYLHITDVADSQVTYLYGEDDKEEEKVLALPNNTLAVMQLGFFNTNRVSNLNYFC